MTARATIRVMSAEEIAARAGGETPFLQWPDRRTTFAERAMRLRQLSRGHPMGDFLAFAARIASAQHEALAAAGPVPLPGDEAVARAAAMREPPIPARDWPRDPAWRDALARIVAATSPAAPPAARTVLDRLRDAGADVLEAQADALLENTATGLDLGAAPLVGAALQVHWTHLLLSLRERLGDAPLPATDDATRCPACGSLPTASITLSGGDLLGQRYLHCSLCSLRWHLPRTRCPRCLATEGIAFHSLDLASTGPDESRAAQAAVRAEACDACGHYLKIVHGERDPQVEPVADDLASVTLDLLVAETGLRRHGANFLLIFGEPPPDPPPDPPPPTP